MPKYSAQEAVARALPGYDRALADRLINWLDRCGYSIVEKVQLDTPLSPVDQTETDQLQERV